MLGGLLSGCGSPGEGTPLPLPTATQVALTDAPTAAPLPTAGFVARPTPAPTPAPTPTDTEQIDTAQTDTGQTDTGQTDTGQTDTGQTDTAQTDDGPVAAAPEIGNGAELESLLFPPTFAAELDIFVLGELKFATGESSATADFAVIRGQRDLYAIDVAAGQTALLTVESLEDNAVFDLYGPDGQVLVLESTSASIVFDVDGLHWIVVGGTRGNATYTLEVAVN